MNAVIKSTSFNTVLRRHVACIRSSLLLKIQWKEHHNNLYKHGCYSVQDLWSSDQNGVESGSMCREGSEILNLGRFIKLIDVC
jgi:hypothetical protein